LTWAAGGGYPAFCKTLPARLRPGGRVLIQQMSRGRTAPGGGAFIESHVAADMHTRPVGETVGLLERAGLVVLAVESMRPHCVRTIRAWLDNLERNFTAAEAVIGAELGPYVDWVTYCPELEIGLGAEDD
jgi:cyclopropane-fatty-acyl-phospholipid synthase